jgi:hypothetical protein
MCPQIPSEKEVLRRIWRICESVKSYILPNPFDNEKDSDFFKSLVVSAGNKLKIRMNAEDGTQVLLGGKKEVVENALLTSKSKYELFPTSTVPDDTSETSTGAKEKDESTSCQTGSPSADFLSNRKLLYQNNITSAAIGKFLWE